MFQNKISSMKYVIKFILTKNFYNSILLFLLEKYFVFQFKKNEPICILKIESLFIFVAFFFLNMKTCQSYTYSYQLKYHIANHFFGDIILTYFGGFLKFTKIKITEFKYFLYISFFLIFFFLIRCA